MMDSGVVGFFRRLDPELNRQVAKFAERTQRGRGEKSLEKFSRSSLLPLRELGVLAVQFFDFIHHPGTHQEP
jgi:hypothetical protein